MRASNGSKMSAKTGLDKAIVDGGVSNISLRLATDDAKDAKGGYANVGGLE